MSNSISIPSGFKEVTKAEFWEWVKTTPRNIHPTPEKEAGYSNLTSGGYVFFWHDLRTRELLGKSSDLHCCLRESEVK